MSGVAPGGVEARRRSAGSGGCSWSAYSWATWCSASCTRAPFTRW